MSIGQRLAIRYIRTKFSLLSALSKKKAAREAFELFCTPQYRNRKKLPPVFEKAEKIEFYFEGNKVRGYRFNHPSENRIIICHGFESSVINFDRYIKPLVKKGYEVIAVDAPAHGRSSGRKINVRMYKNMIHELNRKFGPVKNFMGHSLGGLALTLFMEELEHDPSYKLVLIAPASETLTAIDNFFRFLKLDNGVRAEFEKLIEKIGGQPAGWYSVARAADNIRAEVLFLQDQDDDMTPMSDVEPLIRKNRPNFRFVISEGLGHRRIYRDNQSFREIIGFF